MSHIIVNLTLQNKHVQANNYISKHPAKPLNFTNKAGK